MQRFQVPQFITVEDKIIGPLTLKQILYLASGVGIILLAFWKLQGVVLFTVFGIVGALSASLAFLKISDQPFSTIFKNAIMYFLRPHVYIWKKAVPTGTQEKEEEEVETIVKETPRMSHSKLTELSWSLDTRTGQSETRRASHS